MIDHTVPGFGTYQYDQDLYDEAMARTVPDLLTQVLEQVRDLDRGSVTKARRLRKAELAAMVAEWSTGARDNDRYSAQMDALQAEADMTGHWAEQGADVDPEDVQVFQGAMHEATTPEAIGDTLRVLASSVTGVADALNTVGLAAQSAARKLAAVAWERQVAVVKSMGRTVRGKVVDTVLRAPGPDGMGRVCLVVQHDGHPTRRTLHTLADVQFEALAS